jgi:hypothetical protein
MFLLRLQENLEINLENILYLMIEKIAQCLHLIIVTVGEEGDQFQKYRKTIHLGELLMIMKQSTLNQVTDKFQMCSGQELLKLFKHKNNIVSMLVLLPQIKFY